MKRLQHVRPNNLDRLHDELLAAIPALRPRPNERGILEAVMQVEGSGDRILLTVPDATDDLLVRGVVQAHVAPPPAPPPEVTFLAATPDERVLILARRLGLRV